VADAVRFDPRLNRPVRSGGLLDQAASTYVLAARAVKRRRFDEARALGRFTEEEAREGHELFPEFADRARAFLLREGVTPERLAQEERRIADVIRLPDGSPFDLERGWVAYVGALERFETACEAEDEQAALHELDLARSAWRETHDRACDLVYGLVDVGARLLGENRIGEMWDHLMDALYPSRDRYDVRKTPWADSVEVLVLDAADSLRGHLSGPSRSGEIEIEEQPDRFVLRFDPCGSGGRTLRPDNDGGPPRMEPPFDFAVTTRKHDWAWNTEGVCLYCVHCCQLQERAPIRRLGYPVRVVDPPVWPNGGDRKCTWTVYKDPSLVPDDAYRRVGLNPPTDRPATTSGPNRTRGTRSAPSR
jgi:hypothetical protein